MLTLQEPKRLQSDAEHAESCAQVALLCGDKKRKEAVWA